MQTQQLSWAASFGLYVPVNQGKAEVVLGKSSFKHDDAQPEHRRIVKEEEYKELSAMFDSGLNVYQIAEKTGINFRYVRRILIRCGKINHIDSRKKARKVVQLSVNGDYVSTYDSVVHAASSLRIDTDGIFKCCNKKRDVTQGYKFAWAYQYFGTKDDLEEDKIISSKPINIDMFAQSGEYIRTFASISQAAKTMRIARTSIRRNLDGLYKLARGYCFKYSSDNLKKIDRIKGRILAVDYMNANGEVIDSFDSMKEAQKVTACPYYWIKKSVDNGYKFDDGSYFKLRG